MPGSGERGRNRTDHCIVTQRFADLHHSVSWPQRGQAEDVGAMFSDVIALDCCGAFVASSHQIQECARLEWDQDRRIENGHAVLHMFAVLQRLEIFRFEQDCRKTDDICFHFEPDDAGVLR